MAEILKNFTKFEFLTDCGLITEGDLRNFKYDDTASEVWNELIQVNIGKNIKPYLIH